MEKLKFTSIAVLTLWTLYFVDLRLSKKQNSFFVNIIIKFYGAVKMYKQLRMAS